jgi:hypothetical protein
MKQIGARQEAGRIGGLGSCGRELCCTSWIASFTSVTTGAARTQDISLNPQKLAGQCCKLKCCLAYELDAYIDARKSLPRVNAPLQAQDGEYWLVSSDVLRGTMSFSTVKGAAVGSIVLTADKVRDILEANRRGQKPATITGLAPARAAEEEPAFVNMVGEESITRFDRSSEGKRRRGRGNQNRNRPGGRDGEGRDRNNGDERRAENRGENRENRGENRENRENRGGQNHNSNHRPRPTGQQQAGGGRAEGEPRQGGQGQGGGGGQGGHGRRGGNRNRGQRPKTESKTE